MPQKNKRASIGLDRNINPMIMFIVKFDVFQSRVAVAGVYCTNPECD